MNINTATITELERQLSAMHSRAIEARDAAQGVIEQVRKIRSFLTVVQTDAIKAELAAVPRTDEREG